MRDRDCSSKYCSLEVDERLAKGVLLFFNFYFYPFWNISSTYFWEVRCSSLSLHEKSIKNGLSVALLRAMIGIIVLQKGSSFESTITLITIDPCSSPFRHCLLHFQKLNVTLRGSFWLALKLKYMPDQYSDSMSSNNCCFYLTETITPGAGDHIFFWHRSLIQLRFHCTHLRERDWSSCLLLHLNETFQRRGRQEHACLFVIGK